MDLDAITWIMLGTSAGAVANVAVAGITAFMKKRRNEALKKPQPTTVNVQIGGQVVALNVEGHRVNSEDLQRLLGKIDAAAQDPGVSVPPPTEA
jgi:hypothetical protein